MNSGSYPFMGEHDARSCINCQIGHLCLGRSCTRSQLLHIDHQIKHQIVANKGATITTQNSLFSDCYIVKAGAVKTTFLNERGDEKIMGFHLPGEAFGLQGILEGRNTCSAVALERSTLCKINYKKFHEFVGEIPMLQEWLLRRVLQELHSVEVLNRWLSYATAEERVVSFLMDLSERQRLRSWHAGDFRLPMSRRDIANYLGLALETISRVLHRLQRVGDLSVRNRHIEFLQFDSLRERLASVETTMVHNTQLPSHSLYSSLHVPFLTMSAGFVGSLRLFPNRGTLGHRIAQAQIRKL